MFAKTDDGLRLGIGDWTGGNTYVQGLNYHRRSGTVIGHNARNVKGQVQQDIAYHQMLANGDVATVVAKKAGHGSSTGLEDLGEDLVAIWSGHDGLGTSGYVKFRIGDTGNVAFTPVDLPEGDIEIDNENGRLILRNGNRYRLYDLASVKAGNRVKLADFTIPSWGKRWQGMFLADDHLFVHRDVETKGASQATVFDLTKAPKDGSLFKPFKTTSTTNMGDEAEGFYSIMEGDNEVVYIVKRTGAKGAKRILELTRYMTLAKSKPWDGKSFPGVDAFIIGQSNPAVTLLGKRLVAHGYTGYTSGPGPRFTEADKAAVAWFQRKQGWTGSGADGYPGAKTWAELMKEPKPKPEPEPEPPTKEEEVDIVSRAMWGAKPWAGVPAGVAMTEKRHFLVHYHGGPVADQYGVEVPRLVESIHRANGWSGPGYNFMVDMDGIAYEGRGWGLVGAHCPGRNRDGIGVYVAVGGDQEPTPKALETVRALYAEANRRAGRTLEKCYHSKHYATSCPGDRLRKWVDAGMPATQAIPEPEKPPVVVPPVVTPPAGNSGWDGVSFPGASAFVIGSPHPAVKVLGERLKEHGWKGYKVGPGIPMGTTDILATKWFQGLQGWSGDDADGVPGKETWKRLMAPPVTRPTPPAGGAPIHGRVTTPFKAKGSWAWSQGHPGADWNGTDPDFGNPVFASVTGIVKQIGRGWNEPAYGDAIVIQDLNGTTQTLYAHTSAIKVLVGQVVQVGDLIGSIGFSGNVIPKSKGGSHVHVERRKAPYRYGTDVVAPKYGD